MKLSKQTLEILQGISLINNKSPVNGAVFKKGNTIKVRRYKQTMPVMYARVADEFPRDFAVYDMNKFISTANLFEEPELSFENQYIVFKSGKRKAKIRYVAENLIEPDTTFFDKQIKLPSVDFQCTISNDTLKSILDSDSMYKSPQIAFIGDGTDVFLTTYNTRDTNSDSLQIEVGQTSDEFTIIVDTDLLKFLKRDYQVSISYKGLLEWKSNDVVYYITAMEKSKVNK